jgi:hypothetical protein
MKEHPILFSGPMVKAILEGRKTQTRRVVNPQPPENLWEIWKRFPNQKPCPYGAPGDRLWVRETWKPLGSHSQPVIEELPPVMTGVAPAYEVRRGACYRVDGEIRWDSHVTTIHDLRSDAPTKGKSHLPVTEKWKPSIFMPRWASRVTLEIINVRVERLQEITEADAVAEGVQCDPMFPAALTDRTSFSKGWDTINGKRKGCVWSDNPWVWVVGFKSLASEKRAVVVDQLTPVNALGFEKKNSDCETKGHSVTTV